MQDIMSSQFLHEISTWTNRRYALVGRTILRHLHLLDVGKELKGRFPSSKGSGVAAMDDKVVMECEEETAMFLILAANALIPHQPAVFYAWPFHQSALLLLT